jgi:hypothetical protein
MQNRSNFYLELLSESTSSEKEARANSQKHISKVLESLGLQYALRGSWLNQDFHWNSKLNKTYSDLDLIITHISEPERFFKCKEIMCLLQPFFEVHASAHSEDALSVLSLNDSITLNVAEFIYKFSQCQKNPSAHCYTLAKFGLRLLREHTNEGNFDIAERLGNDTARLALKNKLGLANSFSDANFEKLLSSSEHPLVQMCKQYVFAKDGMQVIAREVRVLLPRCVTVSDWLEEYLLAKLTSVAI